MKPVSKKFRKYAANTGLAALLAAMLAGPVAGNAGEPANSVYCRDDLKAEVVDLANFANIHQPDGSMLFAANAHGNNAVYSAYGRADKVGENHWRWTDDPALSKCVMDIKFENDVWSLNPATDCNARRGERAPRSIPSFSDKFLITAVPQSVVNGPAEGSPGDNLQIMLNSAGTCPDLKKPYKQSYTTGTP